MNGILIVDKPKGVTSHDIVNIVRKIFKTKKVGHAGTLDPVATGVLVVLIGSETKRSEEFINHDKDYSVTLRLGLATDTGDSSGKPIRAGFAGPIEPDAVKKAIMSFVGEIEQAPPMYSAVKFKGRNLYYWARKGVEVPRKTRKVIIKSIDIKTMSLPEVIFCVSCSKGTYMRQLCADIGDKLDCGGYMAELRRTRSGCYDISQALTVEKLKSLGEAELSGILR